MKIKKNNGLTGIDMILAIMAIIIFSALIFSLMYNNALENLKIKKETLATIYLTETLEKVGIATYDQITQEYIDEGNLIPNDMPATYKMEIQVITDDLSILDEQKENNIIKKVVATITYKVGNKDYKLSMERMKVKE